MINQLALIEMTYLFLVFAKRVYAESVGSKSGVHVRLKLYRIAEGGHFYLENGPLSRWQDGTAREATSDPAEVRLVVPGDESPERSAFVVLSELYALFSHDNDQIPYATEGPSGLQIDPQQIISART